MNVTNLRYLESVQSRLVHCMTCCYGHLYSFLTFALWFYSIIEVVMIFLYALMIIYDLIRFYFLLATIVMNEFVIGL